MSGWSPDRENLLRILWTQGLSAGQIAKRLGGVSRSAVISKKDRMGLPKRTECSGGTDKERGARVKAIAKVSAPTPMVAPVREKGAARGPHNIPFNKRTESSCLLFLGGESRDTGLICGRPREDGKPYCSECKRIAYLPAEAKRRAA